MYAYVLPISGGYMPAQIQLLVTLAEAGYRPDVTFGCSGGNVASYLGLSSDWSPDTLRVMVRKLCDSINLKPKTKFTTVNIALGLVSSEGGMYVETGVEDFFKKHVTSESIRRTEIWTAAYNKLSNRSVFFCNRSKNDSILSGDMDHRFASCEPVVYVGDDDPHHLYLVSKSSATIPMLLPDVFIGQEPYIDGGVNWSTPAVPMLDNLPDMCHIVHICGNNVDTPDTRLQKGNIVGEGFRVFSMMSEGHIIQERFALYKHMKNKQKIHGLKWNNEIAQEASLASLQNMKKISDQSKFSLLFINPLYNRTTKLYDVKYESVARVMKLTEQYFNLELIYLT